MVILLTNYISYLCGLQIKLKILTKHIRENRGERLRHSLCREQPLVQVPVHHMWCRCEQRTKNEVLSTMGYGQQKKKTKHEGMSCSMHVNQVPLVHKLRDLSNQPRKTLLTEVFSRKTENDLLEGLDSWKGEY